jgi:hypothetical protein
MAIVAYRQGFCNSCGKKLHWPRQPAELRQPAHSSWDNEPQYNTDRYPDDTPPKKTSFLNVALLAILFVVLSIGGIALATNGDVFSMLSPPVVKLIEIKPLAITQGQKATLQWNVAGATSVTISPDIGLTSPDGTMTVNPAANTTYTITASNGMGSATSSTTLAVTPLSPPVIAAFTASPAAITTGKTSSLQWNVTGEATVSIDNGIGIVSSSGTRQLNPNATTTYTLTAANATSTITGTTIITVTQPATLVINSFTANPSTITVGQSSNLQWDISGAESVTITPGIGAVSNIGTKSITPTSSTGYCLTAANSSETKNASASVMVMPRGQPPPVSGIPTAPAWLPS